MKYLTVFFLSLFCCQLAAADFQIDVLTDKLQQPWGLAQLPDKRLLVTEKAGRLRVVNQQGELSSPVTGLPEIKAIGQGGLLDVALHPNFIANRWVYLSYVNGNAVQGYGTEVVRGVFNQNRLSQLKTIFVALPKVTGGRHFGSRLAFDAEGYLYISLGDRGRREEAQNLGSHLGSMIRLQDNGDIPSDNPFLNIKGAKPEIYSYGHRNIQGLTLHPQTGVLWSHEHGPQGGDEINIVERGKNYGWPVITYGAEYGTGIKIGEGNRKPGMEQPIYHWTPSIAPSGMAFFQDRLWVGALKYQLITSLTIKERLVLKEQRLFANQFGRIRDVKAFDDKTLYLLTDANQGKLIRLTKK